MRGWTLVAVAPTLLTMSLQSYCRLPKYVGLIRFSLDGAVCKASATDVEVAQIGSDDDSQKALWFVSNECGEEKVVTVGKFSLKGQAGYFDVMSKCVAEDSTTAYLKVGPKRVGLLRCTVRQECAKKDDFSQYRYGVCANGKFVIDPDLRVKGGSGRPDQDCPPLDKAEVEKRCASTPIQ